MISKAQLDDLVDPEKYRVVHDKSDDYWYLIDASDKSEQSIFSSIGCLIEDVKREYNFKDMRQAFLFMAVSSMETAEGD